MPSLHRTLEVFPFKTRYVAGNMVRIQADIIITTNSHPITFPTCLWFDAPLSAEAHIANDRLDAAVVALLQAAMALDLAIHAHGLLSHRLAAGLSDYQKLLTSAFPNLRQIDITQEGDAERIGPAYAVAAGFSAGVDSLFTLATYHSAKCEKITHCYFANVGPPFGNTPTRRAKYRRALAQYQPLLRGEGILCVPLISNANDFHRPAGLKNWTQTFGSITLSLALLMQKVVRKYIMSSDVTLEQLREFPTGASPFLDPLLSTESLQIENYGSQYSRIEKLHFLAEYCPESRLVLNVCSERTTENGNCGRCIKCHRTMYALYRLNLLEEFTCFPKTSFDATSYRRRVLNEGPPMERLFLEEVDSYIGRL